MTGGTPGGLKIFIIARVSRLMAGLVKVNSASTVNTTPSRVHVVPARNTNSSSGIIIGYYYYFIVALFILNVLATFCRYLYTFIVLVQSVGLYWIIYGSPLASLLHEQNTYLVKAW